MIVPTVHLNGTAKAVLIEQQTEVRKAAQALIAALQNATPNGRDYYPQGDSIIQLALNEHNTRMMEVINIRNRAENLAIKLDEQG